jgi:RNA 2',3'-cyclic 3'-phosphodiesterase
MSPNWFIGLRISVPGLRERLGAGPPGVRLIHPDDLHLTLAFLGEVDEAKARAAWAERHRLAPLGPSQRVSFGAVVGLGNPRRPSALSAHLREGEAELRDAIARVRDAMADAAGAPREQRPPLPHVTIARVQRSASSREHGSAIAWARGLNLRSFEALVERVALYTASSGGSERQYREIEEDDLPGGGASAP